MKKPKWQQQEMQGRTNRELLLTYMYDRAEEVLIIAESQFPNETRTIVNRLTTCAYPIKYVPPYPYQITTP